MRDFWENDKPAILFLLVVVLFGAAMAYDHGTATAESVTGVVKERVYTPERSGSGVGFSSSGHSVYTATYEREQWLLVVSRGGSVESLEATPAQWSAAKIGDRIPLQVTHGGLFGTERVKIK